MSNARTFLLVDDPDHGEVVDQWICMSLRDRDGNLGSCWSGIYTDGTRYGVVWAVPASDLFGQPVTEENPDGNPLLVIATETFTDGPDGPVSDWSLLVSDPPVYNDL